MSIAKLNLLMHQIKTLSLDEQHTLNRMLCTNLRHASKAQSIQASKKFEIGQFIEFDGGRRGVVVIQVTGFSRDFSKVKGMQVNAKAGGTGIGTNWTASANLCFEVNADCAVNALKAM